MTILTKYTLYIFVKRDNFEIIYLVNTANANPPQIIRLDEKYICINSL